MAATRESLASDLRRLGIPEGAALIVHSSYRALGPVEGGPSAVVGALCDVLGPSGTLLAPTFTSNLTDPYTWPVPPPPAERLARMDAMPRFDPETSEPHKMGVIAKAVWRAPGAQRSHHPVTSWAAVGALAEELTRDHPLDDPEGIDGPVGRVYRRDGLVLLLGVEHDADTTIHLAESLLDLPHLRELPDRYPTEGPGGVRAWRPITKTTKCSDGFLAVEPAMAAAKVARRGQVAQAAAELLRSRDIVRVTVRLLERDPTALLCADPECVHCPTSRRALAGWRPTAPLELLG